MSDEVITYIWGQTCCSLDNLTKGKLYPFMNENEWMIFRNFGAYTNCLESEFNGFEKPKTFYIEWGTKIVFNYY